MKRALHGEDVDPGDVIADDEVVAFVVDAFHANEPLADSVNHLLVVGFYLINIGYVTLALKYGSQADNVREAIETLSTKVGMVLVVLGIMHFFNLFIFSRMRRRVLHKTPPPLYGAANA